MEQLTPPFDGDRAVTDEADAMATSAVDATLKTGNVNAGADSDATTTAGGAPSPSPARDAAAKDATTAAAPNAPGGNAAEKEPAMTPTQPAWGKLASMVESIVDAPPPGGGRGGKGGRGGRGGKHAKAGRGGSGAMRVVVRHDAPPAAAPAKDVDANENADAEKAATPTPSADASPTTATATASTLQTKNPVVVVSEAVAATTAKPVSPVTPEEEPSPAAAVAAAAAPAAEGETDEEILARCPPPPPGFLIVRSESVGDGPCPFCDSPMKARGIKKHLAHCKEKPKGYKPACCPPGFVPIKDSSTEGNKLREDAAKLANEAADALREKRMEEKKVKAAEKAAATEAAAKASAKKAGGEEDKDSSTGGAGGIEEGDEQGNGKDGDTPKSNKLIFRAKNGAAAKAAAAAAKPAEVLPGTRPRRASAKAAAMAEESSESESESESGSEPAAAKNLAARPRRKSATLGVAAAAKAAGPARRASGGKAAVIMHVDLASKGFKCGYPDCGKIFGAQSGLKRHVTVSHAKDHGDQPFTVVDEATAAANKGKAGAGGRARRASAVSNDFAGLSEDEDDELFEMRATNFTKGGGRGHRSDKDATEISTEEEDDDETIVRGKPTHGGIARFTAGVAQDEDGDEDSEMLGVVAEATYKARAATREAEAAIADAKAADMDYEQGGRAGRKRGAATPPAGRGRPKQKQKGNKGAANAKNSADAKDAPKEKEVCEICGKVFAAVQGVPSHYKSHVAKAEDAETKQKAERALYQFQQRIRDRREKAVVAARSGARARREAEAEDEDEDEDSPGGGANDAAPLVLNPSARNCSHCGQGVRFSTQKDLISHMWSEHKVVAISDPSLVGGGGNRGRASRQASDGWDSGAAAAAAAAAIAAYPNDSIGGGGKNNALAFPGVDAGGTMTISTGLVQSMISRIDVLEKTVASLGYGGGNGNANAGAIVASGGNGNAAAMQMHPFDAAAEIKRIPVRGARPGYSPIVTFGRMVWLTGIVALQTVDQDVEGQTRQALEHMTLLLHKAGTDPTHLLRLNVYLADIRCADRMYKAWNEYFEGLGLSEGQRPVRITHEARLKNEGFRVEVHAEAVLPAK